MESPDWSRGRTKIVKVFPKRVQVPKKMFNATLSIFVIEIERRDYIRSYNRDYIKVVGQSSKCECFSPMMGFLNKIKGSV